MTYRKSIPIATERPSVSQPKIKENFTEINDQFGVDHTELEESTQQGKHKKVTLYEQADDPTTTSDEVAIYTKEGDNGTEIYYRNESDGEVLKLVGLKVLAIATVGANGGFIGDKFNCASVIVVTTVREVLYTITFSTPLLTADYKVHVTTASAVCTYGVESKTVNSVRVRTHNQDGYSFIKTNFDIMVYKV